MVSCESITILELKSCKSIFNKLRFTELRRLVEVYCKKGNLQTAEGKLQLTQRQCAVLQSLLLLFSDYELNHTMWIQYYLKDIFEIKQHIQKMFF